jgi:hypothetical protein
MMYLVLSRERIVQPLPFSILSHAHSVPLPHVHMSVPTLFQNYWRDRPMSLAPHIRRTPISSCTCIRKKFFRLLRSGQRSGHNSGSSICSLYLFKSKQYPEMCNCDTYCSYIHYNNRPAWHSTYHPSPFYLFMLISFDLSQGLLCPLQHDNARKDCCRERWASRGAVKRLSPRTKGQ